jgi:hypothetical protein
MQIGDKVRTKPEWNDHREPTEGTITGFETLKYHKIEYEPIQDNRTGLISYFARPAIPTQYEYTEVVVLDNGEQIHESNLEKVG